jgi:histone-lysine N-methyltransferase SETMAR
LVARYKPGGDDFLSTIVTGDEIWIHHFETETKRQSMEWHHTNSPRKRKFKAIPSASKIMATVFWDCEVVILIDVLPRGQTINSDVYVETLKKLKKHFRKFRPHKDVTKMFLHHDNARPHTSLHTREAITKLQWTVLPHPPYSPDVAPSDYRLFSPLKDAIRGKKFEDDEEGPYYPLGTIGTVPKAYGIFMAKEGMNERKNEK